MALVVLNASVVFACLGAADAHHPAAVQALEKVRSERLVVPMSAYAKGLVGPAQLRRLLADALG